MKNAQQYWSRHIAAIKFQGTTASAYARKHKLALATLYYWQRRLRSSATVVAAMEPGVAPQQHSKFIALTIGDSLADVARSGTPCTLVLSSGMRLELSTLPDPQWLAALGRSAQGAY